MYQLFTDFKKSYDSVRREVSYNTGIPMKLVRLIKMCLNEANSIVRVGKHLFCLFPIENGLNKKLLYRDCFFNFSLGYVITGVQANQEVL